MDMLNKFTFYLLYSQAYLRQYGYLNDPADPQDPHHLEEIIEALR